MNLSLSIIAFAFRVKELRDLIPGFFGMVQSMRFFGCPRKPPLTLDTANFYWFGHPLSKVYELYETFAPRVFHTHCKSIRFPEPSARSSVPWAGSTAKYNCPLYEGDIDFRRVREDALRGGLHRRPVRRGRVAG